MINEIPYNDIERKRYKAKYSVQLSIGWRINLLLVS